MHTETLVARAVVGLPTKYHTLNAHQPPLLMRSIKLVHSRCRLDQDCGGQSQTLQILPKVPTCTCGRGYT
jgi:hypothetical protein